MQAAMSRLLECQRTEELRVPGEHVIRAAEPLLSLAVVGHAYIAASHPVSADRNCPSGLGRPGR